MKSKIVNVGKPTRVFPLIAKVIDSGDIILFSSNYVGVVIFGQTHPLGNHSDNWLDCTDTNYWQILDSVTITFES